MFDPGVAIAAVLLNTRDKFETCWANTDSGASNRGTSKVEQLIADKPEQQAQPVPFYVLASRPSPQGGWPDPRML